MLTVFWRMQVTEPTLPEKDKKALKSKVGELKKLEKAGGGSDKLPSKLSKAIKTLDASLKAGKGLKPALEAAQKALKDYESDLSDSCKSISKKGAVVKDGKVSVGQGNGHQGYEKPEKLKLKDGGEFEIKKGEDNAAASKRMKKAGITANELRSDLGMSIRTLY